MKKRILAIVMAVVTMLGSSVVAFADTNDDLLAQYYAALAKMTGGKTTNTDDLLAQYYAALAKQGKTAPAQQTKVNEPIEVTDATFQAEVLNSKGITIVDFYADWCGPCQRMKPVMKSIAQKHPEYKIVEVNIDYNDIAASYGVNSIPNFFVFKDGKLKGNFVGSSSEASTLNQIKKLAK